MRKRIGLKTLASELGMDASTVSRALRNDPRVRSETREAVQRLALKLDYKPNAAARALRMGKSQRVAVLLSPPQQRFASPIFLELLSTLDQRVRNAGKSLAVFAAHDRDEETSIVQQILDEGLADGLILGRTRKDDPRVGLLMERGLPFVTFGRTDVAEQHPLVEIDYSIAGRLAVRALGESTDHPIDILSAPQGYNFADNYVRGALDEAGELGLPTPVVHRIYMTEDGGEEAADTLLAERAHRAFACIQDSLAFGVFRSTAKAGLTVGKELAVFGGQNFPGSEHTAPPLSTFSTEDRHVAELLSDVMLRHLARDGEAPSEGFEHHEIAPKPLLRRSHLLTQE